MCVQLLMHNFPRVPFSFADAVFTLDTASGTLTLHSAQAKPSGGGTLLASGTISTNPAAEFDPAAMQIAMEGHGVSLEWLLQRYVSPAVAIPPTLVLGEGHVQGSIKGSHMEPTIDVAWQAPEAQVCVGWVGGGGVYVSATCSCVVVGSGILSSIEALSSIKKH